MRLGIFGGTFDPVHFGHLLLAECCREQCGLDAIWFTPAHIPPHKQHDAITPGRERAEMLELALAGNAAFSVCRLELECAGVSYTVDTLEAIQRENPARELTLLLGADSLADLPHWKDPRRICELATLAIARRSESGPVEAVQSDEGPPNTGSPDQLDTRPLEQAIGPEAAAGLRIARVELPRIDLGSRDLRRRIAAGASIRYRTPRAVEKYIETAGLYRGAT